jgi:hypothetical protein
MWWEYIIIFGGLALAVAYVLWTFVRSFRAKGACCSSSCACAPEKAESSRDGHLRVTPLVTLRTDKGKTAEAPARERDG